MKRWIGLALLIFVATAGWRIGESLSSDALSMAVGVLFGVMAGVPTALFVMAGSRRRDERAETNQHREERTQMVRSNGPVYGQMPGNMAGHNGYGQGHGNAYGYGQGNQWGAPYAQQPPIIIVAGPQGFGNALPPAPNQSNMAWLPQDMPARQFNVVGNNEEFVEEW